MDLRDGESADSPPSPENSYCPPIKPIGGMLWSLVGVSFMMIWRVGDFVDAPAHLLANAEVIGHVIAVLAMFFLTVPMVYTLRRRTKATETGDMTHTQDKHSESDNPSNAGRNPSQGTPGDVA